MGEQEHDEMQRVFNQSAAELFVDHVQGTVATSDRSTRTNTANTTY
jgi:hypothetical protein